MKVHHSPALPLYRAAIFITMLLGTDGLYADYQLHRASATDRDPERIQLDEQTLHAFKDLVQLLSNQGNCSSPALGIFQQKLPKYKKVPREAIDLFPEIYAYITKAQQHTSEQQEYIMHMGALLPELHDILQQLNKLLHSELQVSDDEFAKAVSASSISPSLCNTLDIRTLMCRIGNILIGMEEDLAGKVAYVDNNVSYIKTKVDTIDSRTQTLQTGIDTLSIQMNHIQDATSDVESKVVEIADAVDAGYLQVHGVETKVDTMKVMVDAIDASLGTLNTGVNGIETQMNTIGDKVDSISTGINAVSYELDAVGVQVNQVDTKIDDAVAQAAVIITQAQNLLGAKDDVSMQVATVQDIDHAQLTQFEWLKTIARLLLKIECLLHSDCWASCIDTCDI